MTDGPRPDELSGEDRRLFDVLSQAIGPDPVPTGLVARCEGLAAFIGIDDELTALLDEAAADTAAVRGPDPVGEAVVFEAGDGAWSVELVLTGGRIEGQLLSGDAANVSLERSDESSDPTTIDPLGRFSFATSHGPVRLRFTGSTGSGVTTWFVP